MTCGLAEDALRRSAATDGIAQIAPATGRHRLGVTLRHLREARSLRLEDVAIKLGLAPSTLSRIETGKAPTKALYLDAMLDLYEIEDPHQRTMLINMAQEGLRKEWWDYYRHVLPIGAGTYLGLEAVACQVREYAAEAVPALLQTPGYAKAACRATRPDLTDNEADELAALQRRRQKLLRDGRRQLHLVMDESVLLRSIGSGQVMADQLEHLVNAVDSLSVTVQVVALTRTRSVLSSSFAVLSFHDPADPGVGSYDRLDSQVVITKRLTEVAAMRSTFDALAKSALSPASSATLIASHAKRATNRL